MLLGCLTHCLRVVYFLDLAQPRAWWKVITLTEDLVKYQEEAQEEEAPPLGRRWNPGNARQRAFCSQCQIDWSALPNPEFTQHSLTDCLLHGTLCFAMEVLSAHGIHYILTFLNPCISA